MSSWSVVPLIWSIEKSEGSWSSFWVWRLQCVLSIHEYWIIVDEDDCQQVLVQPCLKRNRIVHCSTTSTSRYSIIAPIVFHLTTSLSSINIQRLPPFTRYYHLNGRVEIYPLCPVHNILCIRLSVIDCNNLPPNTKLVVEDEGLCKRHVRGFSIWCSGLFENKNLVSVFIDRDGMKMEVVR